MRMKRITSIAVAAAGLVATALATAPSASAAPNSANSTACSDPGFVCIYYHSQEYAVTHTASNGRADYGAEFETAANISNYGSGWQFYAGYYGGEGAGLSVKNNAAFVDNWNETQTYRVYYNSGYSCSVACQDFGPGRFGDLNAKMQNNNASGKFL
ncbi:hypothetical protein [Streptomyces sp. NBC_01497]|uniref:hypothetical protein n=1 Tax=Streptomyces sp. NBC_01497 TaxID=2903885 RepID=UPI002E381E10|nr:hypothetical protein [Streptomyces sp. NBC_01497]